MEPAPWDTHPCSLTPWGWLSSRLLTLRSSLRSWSPPASRTLQPLKAVAACAVGSSSHCVVGVWPAAECNQLLWCSTAGGFRPQAQVAEEALKVLQQARALQAAGCFAMVLECVPAAIAAAVTGMLDIPTIGIGAGPACSGQVRVHGVPGGLPAAAGACAWCPWGPACSARYVHMVCLGSAYRGQVRAHGVDDGHRSRFGCMHYISTLVQNWQATAHLSFWAKFIEM